MQPIVCGAVLHSKKEIKFMGIKLLFAITISTLNYSLAMEEVAMAPGAPTLNKGNLAVICQSDDGKRTLDIYKDHHKIRTMSETSFTRLNDVQYNPHNQIFYVNGIMEISGKSKEVIATYKNGKEFFIEISDHIWDSSDMYVTQDGMIFSHSLPCGCCVGQNALAIIGDNVQKIHFPFQVDRRGFNSKTGELSFIGDSRSLTLKSESGGKAVSVTVRFLMEDKLYQFKSLEWPKEPASKHVISTVHPLKLFYLKQKPGTEELEDVEIPSQASLYGAALEYPLYTKVTNDGMIIHASFGDSTMGRMIRGNKTESIPTPGFLTIAKGVISPVCFLNGLKGIDDIDGYEGTVVACGPSVNNENIMLILRDGQILQSVDLKMSILNNIKIHNGEGKVSGYPDNFKFYMDKTGAYLGDKEPEGNNKENETTLFLSHGKTPAVAISYSPTKKMDMGMFTVIHRDNDAIKYPIPGSLSAHYIKFID